MKKSTLLLNFCFSIFLANCQDLQFKDTNFLAAILELGTQVDTNGDQIIQKSEADSVKKLRLMGKNIQFMEDVYLFSNLESLVLTGNKIKEVNLFGLDKLKDFSCAFNPLRVVIIKSLPALESIAINFCDTIHTLTLENLPNLESFSASLNNLTSFDPAPFPKLKYLIIADNKIKTIDITKNPEMVQVIIDGNLLSELNISHNPKLKTYDLYVDSLVKIIATEEQQKKIKELGLGRKIKLSD